MALVLVLRCHSHMYVVSGGCEMVTSLRSVGRRIGASVISILLSVSLVTTPVYADIASLTRIVSAYIPGVGVKFLRAFFPGGALALLAGAALGHCLMNYKSTLEVLRANGQRWQFTLYDPNDGLCAATKAQIPASSMGSQQFPIVGAANETINGQIYCHIQYPATTRVGTGLYIHRVCSTDVEVAMIPMPTSAPIDYYYKSYQACVCSTRSATDEQARKLLSLQMGQASAALQQAIADVRSRIASGTPSIAGQLSPGAILDYGTTRYQLGSSADGVVTQEADSDVWTGAVPEDQPGTPTEPYVPTGQFGDFVQRFRDFINTMKTTGLFSLPTTLTQSIDAGTSVIEINAGQYGRHQVDFADSAWSAAWITMRGLWLAICSYIALKIVAKARS